jgi:lysozyme
VNHEELKKSLILHESLKLKPYQCTAGKTTIGIGRNLDDIGISTAEAMVMLDNDIGRAVAELNRARPGWKGHDDTRQNVLVEMVFNLGMPRLLGFQKMWAALDAKDYNEAAKQMLQSRWAVQVGQRAKTLSDKMRQGNGTA